MNDGERLQRLEANETGQDQRITRNREDIEKLVLRIDGPPRHDSLSGRVHRLENDAAAANAAKAALDAVTVVRREQETRRWTVADKVFAAVIACIVAFSPWLQYWLGAKR